MLKSIYSIVAISILSLSSLCSSAAENRQDDIPVVPINIEASKELLEMLADYFEVWHTSDDAHRVELMNKVWSSDGVFVDPLAEKIGRDKVTAHAKQFHERNPNHRFIITGKVKAHHKYVRYDWILVDGNGERILKGEDTLVLEEDGKIRRAIGFFSRWMTDYSDE